MFKTKTQRPVQQIAGYERHKYCYTNTNTQLQQTHLVPKGGHIYLWWGDAEAFRPRWLFWLSLRIKKTQLEKKVLAMEIYISRSFFELMQYASQMVMVKRCSLLKCKRVILRRAIACQAWWVKNPMPNYISYY